MKVLIVEDEALVRRGIMESINWEKLHCHPVFAARNGLEGLACFKEENVDLVITDIQMPRMDGLTMSRKILEIDPNVAIIILTAYDEFSYAQEALRLHVVDYLLKPFRDGEMEALIQKVGEKREALRQRLMGEDREEAEIDNPYLAKAFQFIRDHYGKKDLTIKEIAEGVGISESYISHLFKEELSMTVLQYLVGYRMKKAVDLLSSHQYKVYEVCEMVGYSDLSYFGKSFKKILGKRPSDFLK